MDEKPDLELDPIRQRLFEAKLGALAKWTIPPISQTVGPFEPEAFETFDMQRRELVGAVRNRLRTYTDDEIYQIAEHTGREEPETIAFWRSYLSAPISDLKKRIPPWYAGGFGHPEHVADFDYWSKMRSFSLEEALCLSIGIDPKHFDKRAVADLKREKFDSLCPPLQFLLRRHEQMKRQFDPQGLDWSVGPKDFLTWTRKVRFEAHPEFLVLLEEVRLREVDQESPVVVSKRTDRREVDTIAQLFTAMAIDVYGYDPKRARNTATKDITDLAASMGMEVSDDTVRKYLKIGASFIPVDWKPEKDYSVNE